VIKRTAHCRNHRSGLETFRAAKTEEMHGPTAMHSKDVGLASAMLVIQSRGAPEVAASAAL
jgi:hypothetical protein